MSVLLVIPACVATGPAAEEDPDEPAAVDLSEYEDFDPRPYREEAPTEEAVQLEHEVPETLMEGQTGSGELVEREGFRIQLYSSINRDEASSKRSEFADWWEEQGSGEQAVAELPTYLKYKQPYYRVRVGNFTSRAQAQQFLNQIQEEFSGAFLVPTTVLVRR